MPAPWTVTQKQIFLKTERFKHGQYTNTTGSELAGKGTVGNVPPSLCAAIYFAT